MHSIYEKDKVLDLYQHLGKVVQVSLSNKTVFEGTVFTIDPVSRSVILLERESGRLQILMGHAVTLIQDCPGVNAEDVSNLLPSTNVPRGPSGGIEAVKQWFKTHRINVEELKGGILVVGGAVTLCAPYVAEMCTGDNEMVVDRIREVLRRMPKD
ncbi:uncharacterized protein LOC132195141 [Neocloeon triangulifer]|uniref:uncharacterized protein LOC132195141 n=1 Tax=Neocloeon triangulifer TaxID=2078957 RepID=UPI00286EED9B|nr:uncharacterized protein LOC132195141 [Neocloeon triangulifer]